MDYFEAPIEVQNLKPQFKKRIFLAGGITGCPNWQQQAVTQLRDLPVCIYNPRRKDFPEDLNDSADTRAQIEWEFATLTMSDIILFWFPKESICPIALYELGRWNAASMGKTILIGAHPEYVRRRDVCIQIELATGATIFDDLNQLLKHVRTLI